MSKHSVNFPKSKLVYCHFGINWSSFTARWTCQLLMADISHKSCFCRWVAVRRAGSTSLAGPSIIIIWLQQYHLHATISSSSFGCIDRILVKLSLCLGRPSLRSWPGWSTVSRRTKDRRKKISIHLVSLDKNISQLSLWIYGSFRISSHSSFCIIHHWTLCQLTSYYIIYVLSNSNPLILLLEEEEKRKPIFQNWPNIYLHFVSFRQMCFLNNME